MAVETTGPRVGTLVTGLMAETEIDQVDEFLAAGATHLIMGLGDPFDLSPVQRLMELAKG